jgi:UDP-N-acetylglucosamine 2-epimerase (non-hydrolysing)
MKVLVTFGTRPEAVKLAPVIHELRRRPSIDVSVVTTAQHREMVDQVLRVFEIATDADLAVMQPEQTLAELSGRVIAAMDRQLMAARPDLVIVQGDTTSAFMCGLAAFYRQVPVAHVEAGLRTDSPINPFPEEMNRRLTSALTTIHFAPTERARRALVAEGVAGDRIVMTGNTVIDALQQVRHTAAYRSTVPPVAVMTGTRIVLVTLHRRESWGEPLAGMCRAVKAIVAAHPDVRVAFPVHLNPRVRRVVTEELSGVDRVSLVEPLDYLTFVAQMEASTLILTDSGGVQEEAPSLGKPVLVLRETTERPEAVEAGTSRLVGTNPLAIADAAHELLTDSAAYAAMARAVNPFGDGRAAIRIADAIEARVTTARAVACV